MKKIILLLLIAFLCIYEGRMIKKNQCPNSCGCPSTYKPVCGISGRTHGNLCLANCAGDKVLTVGTCSYKCTRQELKNRIRVCRNRLSGQNSYRKQCCTWLLNKGKRTDKKCTWVGEETTIRRKSICKWIIKRKNVTQRRCCKWTERIQGKKIKRSKKVCSYVGREIKKKSYKKIWLCI